MKETCLPLCVAINSTTTEFLAANTRWTFFSKWNISGSARINIQHFSPFLEKNYCIIYCITLIHEDSFSLETILLHNFILYLYVTYWKIKFQQNIFEHLCNNVIISYFILIDKPSFSFSCICVCFNFWYHRYINSVSEIFPFSQRRNPLFLSYDTSIFIRYFYLPRGAR